MAAITVDKPTLVPFAAAALTGAAANSGGDTVANNGKTRILLDNSNAGAGSVTVTVQSRVNCDQGSDHDLSIALTANQKKWLPFLPRARFNDGNGTVSLSYSGTITGLSVAAVAEDQ